MVLAADARLLCTARYLGKLGTQLGVIAKCTRFIFRHETICRRLRELFRGVLYLMCCEWQWLLRLRDIEDFRRALDLTGEAGRAEAVIVAQLALDLAVNACSGATRIAPQEAHRLLRLRIARHRALRYIFSGSGGAVG
jgi:hypothetical protein